MKTKRKPAAPDHSNLRIHPAMKPFVGYCLYKVALKVRALMDKKLVPYEMVAPQMGILTMLKKVGPMTQVELGSFMDIDKATMVRFLDGLEKSGYLLRENHQGDRRAKVLKITSEGEKILVKLMEIRAQVEDQIFAPLTKTERADLKTLISKLALQDD